MQLHLEPRHDKAAKRVVELLQKAERKHEL
jgi:hypothetical protein